MRKNEKDKMDGRYDEGIWVGTSNVDGSSIVLTPEGVRSTRSIRRVPDTGKYDLVFLFTVRGTPWELSGHMLGDVERTEVGTEVIPARPIEEIPKVDPLIEAMPARLRINRSDLITHGYTSRCLGCKQVLENARKNGGHIEECRRRIYPLIASSEAGADRAAETEDRRTDWKKRAEDL